MRNLWSLFLAALSGKVLPSIFSLVPKKPTEEAMFYELMWLQILALTFFKWKMAEKIQNQINIESLTASRDGILSNNYDQRYVCVCGSFVYTCLNAVLVSFFFFPSLFFCSSSTKWLMASSKTMSAGRGCIGRVSFESVTPYWSLT